MDRHVVETCIEASALIRDVSRPDVLLVAALLHDIGKGGLVEHSVAGEPVARAVATRMGFDPEGVDLVARLVRWHLLLAQTATTRDPEDPATVDLVAGRLRDAPAVALLLALSEADARATAPKAWSAWRAGLVRDLAARVVAALGEELPGVPEAPELDAAGMLGDGRVALRVEDSEEGVRVTVVAPDRVGLLADVAAMFALQRATIRAARAWTQGALAVSVWEVADPLVDPAVLRQRFDAVVEGRVDPTARLRPDTTRDLDPTVGVRPEASRGATVLEVRAADRPGVLHLTLAALATVDVSVRSAHVDTLGPQAVDVFYVQESGAGALSETRAAEAAHAVRAVLGGDLGLLSGAARPRVGSAAPRRLGLALGPPPPTLRERHVFATLSDRLADTFKNLRGKGKLSEADIDATAREIRIALLEADVALPVVKEFVAAVKERARGEEVSQALNPAQQVVKIVNDELVDILGGETRRLRFAKSGPP